MLHLSSPRARLVVGLCLALLALQTIWIEAARVLAAHGLWDFGAFLESGRAAARGLDPYGIYPLTPHVRFAGFETWNPNLNPPISALLFQPFDWAEPARSLQIWLWVSVACYGAAVALLLRRYAGRTEAALIAVWTFGLAGFWDTLFLGQIYLPLVLCATAAWLLLQRQELIWSGVLIGLLIAIKPNFLVWPVLLFLAGHRRPALVSVAVAAGISLIPLAVYGPGIYQRWLALVASDGERAFFLTNASISGLAARAGLPGAGLPLSLALLVGLAIWALWRRPGLLEVSGLALLASLMASPLGWVHYTLFLLPVLLHHWRHLPVWIVAALLTVPVPTVLRQFGAEPWLQLTLGSVYGWALMLCLATLIWRSWAERRNSFAT